MKIEKPGNYTVHDGDDVVQVVGTGKGVIITMTGGEVWTCGKSAPVITMTGGLVRTWESSAPVIHQSGGEVRTRESSAPVINMTGGEVRTFGSSAPVITITGGVVRTRESSSPVINMTGGEVWTLDTSAPVINMTGGDVRTFDSSAPVIHKKKTKHKAGRPAERTMRNISFSLTTDQIRNRSKTVTRRMNWLKLKAEDRLQACVKCRGLKPGEKLAVLAVIEVVSVRREKLKTLLGVPQSEVAGDFYTPSEARDEINAEGFPLLTAAEFVKFFCASHKGCTPETDVTRIEFKYVDP